ncbi:MAG: DUF4872 domain-containing protein [Spirochaetales bacterium]|nr:DUF4872 domain-containing protein [Spirochaetales bacterium]
MDPAASGVKKGFYAQLKLAELERARGSTYKPFPPHRAWLEFDFRRVRPPAASDVKDAIRRTARDMLSPPIKKHGRQGDAPCRARAARMAKIFQRAGASPEPVPDLRVHRDRRNGRRKFPPHVLPLSARSGRRHRPRGDRVRGRFIRAERKAFHRNRAALQRGGKNRGSP